MITPADELKGLDRGLGGSAELAVERVDVAGRSGDHPTDEI
ncbi:hypothetical protein OIC43_03570 [Streptomyces sp. NBC_00825]|nr:hypothetical protein OG832_40145 [Streptomyces sp. NBC_00826]WTH88207.1 hypothetical protein OIC43_03570 [Streptomyces sp. NBC_00825]WTH96935.1 hypothetical protein OHA23_03570 [Streptomyces sp. NBC_00822]